MKVWNESIIILIHTCSIIILFQLSAYIRQTEIFDHGNCHVWKDLTFLVLVQNASDSLVIPGCCRCVGHRALNQCDFFWLKTDCCGCPTFSSLLGSVHLFHTGTPTSPFMPKCDLVTSFMVKGSRDDYDLDVVYCSPGVHQSTSSYATWSSASW